MTDGASPAGRPAVSGVGWAGDTDEVGSTGPGATGCCDGVTSAGAGTAKPELAGGAGLATSLDIRASRRSVTPLSWVNAAVTSVDKPDALLSRLERDRKSVV